MNKTILKHLQAVLADNLALAKELPAEAFSKKLPVRSNSLGGQYFCIVGTRQWYQGVIATGKWSAWSCSITPQSCKDKATVVKALGKTSRDLLKLVQAIKMNDVRLDMVLFLIEHESMHLGQLVRYIYGLGYTFPKSVAKKWALKE